MISVKSMAFTVHTDENGMAYVNIQPIEYVMNKPEATRLYIVVNNYTLTTRADILYQLKGAIIIDKETTNYVSLEMESITLIGDDFKNWNDDKYLFSYVAAKKKLVIID